MTESDKEKIVKIYQEQKKRLDPIFAQIEGMLEEEMRDLTEAERQDIYETLRNNR